MDKNVKTFAVVGGMATLCITGVSVVAIMRDAAWVSAGIIVGIVCATITVIVPVAHSISVRLKRSGHEETEVGINIKTREPKEAGQRRVGHKMRKKGGGVLSILVVRSRPDYLYQSLGRDPETRAKHRRPRVVEYKPEIVADVIADGIIIQREFEKRGRRALVTHLESASKGEIVSALREKWDILHFDCVVGPEGQLCLEDGPIAPVALNQLLSGKDISLLVLMDCDSVKVVSTASAAGVGALIAVTRSLPVVIAEKFCYALYASLASGRTIAQSFSDAKAAASVEFGKTWDSNLFFVDGDTAIAF